MAERLKGIGTHIARYGLAIVLLWIGGMMFTAYKAEGIRPLVANSPLKELADLTMAIAAINAWNRMAISFRDLARRLPTGAVQPPPGKAGPLMAP